MKYPVPYLLMLLVPALLCYGCKKSPSEDHTSKLGGIRIWHGHKWGRSLAMGTIYNYDTSFTDTFAITVIDKNTVSVQGDTVYFWHNDGNNTYFHCKNSSMPVPCGQLICYGNDSIVYLNEFDHASGSSAYRLSTP